MAKKPIKKVIVKEKSDPIFLPFDYEVHKENKISLMKTELSVLKCLKILENLKRLQEQKARLKKELQLLLSASLRNFEKTWDEMPMIEHTNEIKKLEKTSNADFGQEYEEKIQYLASAGSDTTALGKELSIIQEKLKKLSSYQ